jgi:hypothetical protein
MVVQGEVSGVGAAIAANAVWGMTRGKVQWRINEPLFGAVPHGG